MIEVDSLPYTIVSKLASDKSSVFLVKDHDNCTEYVLKKFAAHYAGRMQFESEKLIQSLSHPYIIKLRNTHDKEQTVILEHAPNGDFCNLLMGGKGFPEIIARTYFHQLVEGVDYLHKNGIAHLDLKLDNLLLSTNKTLQIIDFDLAQRTEDEQRSFARSKGTANYRAPEIKARKCKDFKAADVYSMGIIVFAMVTGLPPYTESEKGEFDGWYHLMMGQLSNYWGKISKYVNVSEDFKMLFAGMMCKDAEDRLTLDQIRDSEWYHGPILNEQDLEYEMNHILAVARGNENN